MNPERRKHFEKGTIHSMIHLYCRKNHGTKTLCTDCANLLGYAFQRIDSCTLHPNKPVCSACTVHCYKKDLREKIRLVMRYSGPRMLWYRPHRALMYLWLKRQIMVAPR